MARVRLVSVHSCALLKEVIYHGKMYLSSQHICFHSSVAAEGDQGELLLINEPLKNTGQ